MCKLTRNFPLQISDHETIGLGLEWGESMTGVDTQKIESAIQKLRVCVLTTC